MRIVGLACAGSSTSLVLAGPAGASEVLQIPFSPIPTAPAAHPVPVVILLHGRGRLL